MKEDIFFKKKPTLILLTLYFDDTAKYGSKLAKKTDCTYSHTVKILKTLEKLKLIEFEKRGRKKMIKLTNKGKEVAEGIKKVKDLLKV
jgi:DNA-binding MarR family transcriptional regulator